MIFDWSSWGIEPGNQTLDFLVEMLVATYLAICSPLGMLRYICVERSSKGFSIL